MSIIRRRSRRRVRPSDLSDLQVEVVTARDSRARYWKKRKAWGMARRRQSTLPEVELRALWIRKLHQERELAKRHPELEPARQRRLAIETQRAGLAKAKEGVDDE